MIERSGAPGRAGSHRLRLAHVRSQESSKVAAPLPPGQAGGAACSSRRACALMQTGVRGYEAAAAAFRKATQLDPKLFEAWHDLGHRAGAAGALGAGGAGARPRAGSCSRARGATLVALAEALGRSGRHDEAADLLAKRLAVRAQGRRAAPAADPGAARGGRAQRRAGGGGAAARQRQPERPRLQRPGADLLPDGQAGAGRVGPAPRLRARPQEAREVWNNLGLVALARGRDREAFAAFDKAADLDAVPRWRRF